MWAGQRPLPHVLQSPSSLNASASAVSVSSGAIVSEIHVQIVTHLKYTLYKVICKCKSKVMMSLCRGRVRLGFLFTIVPECPRANYSLGADQR